MASTKKASDALREFADVLDDLEAVRGEVEVAGVALVPDVGVVLCTNSETGNDGLIAMLEIGKQTIVKQYLEKAGVEVD